MSKKILIVAAHPDDEILGAGGTLIKHANNGDEVFCLILGTGALSREKATTKEASKLHDDSLAAGKVIGFKQAYYASFPDNGFDTVSLLSIAKAVEKYIEQLQPEVIYTHFENDLNIDHRITFQAVLTACRPCNGCNPLEIYMFETLSSTEWQAGKNSSFRPNHYVNIEKELTRKIKALKKYKGEIRQYPHSRSAEGIKILSQFRGLECGLKFAEAFCLVRKIQN